MMATKSYEEVKNLTIEIITPTAISSGKDLTPNDYLYNQATKEVYFLDALHWHRFIIEHNLFTEYEKYVTAQRPNSLGKKDELGGYKSLFEKKRAEQKNGKKNATNNKKKLMTISLYEWLQQKLNVANLTKEMLGDAVKSMSIAEQRMDKNSLNEIHEHIKLTDGRAYIPGTSIKAVIRTAILYRLLKGNSECRMRYWKKLTAVDWKQKPNQLKKNLSRIADELETELLHLLKLQDIPVGSAVSSTMRGVLCSDAMPLVTPVLGILQKIDVSAENRNKRGMASKKDGRVLPLFREALLPGNKFSTQIKIDKRMTTSIGIESVDDVLQALEEFFAFINQIMKRHFPDRIGLFTESKEGNAYVGAGTGFLTKTLLMALAPTEEKGAEFIAKYLQTQFRKGGHGGAYAIAPHTLKITKYKGQEYLWGVVKFTYE